MKLLLCHKCGDIFNLDFKLKTCSCKESSGKYIDELNAEISGKCSPIGFANDSFRMALALQEIENEYQTEKENVCCKGIDFSAFIIPDWAKSIKKIKT